MLKFGKSISLSADNKLVSRAEDLDMLSGVQIEISGGGFSRYELKVVRDGEKVALLIDCGNLRFLVSGLKKSGALCQNCGKDYFLEETIVDGELRCSCARR